MDAIGTAAMKLGSSRYGIWEVVVKDESIAKVSIVRLGMVDHPGTAATKNVLMRFSTIASIFRLFGNFRD
jgi:hypothetical protein